MDLNQSRLATIMNAEHNSNLIQTLNTFIENESFLDMTFICEGGFKIRSHKLVLSAASPFMKSIIEDAEAKNPEVVILLPEVDHNSLKLLLNFLYEGRMKLDERELPGFRSVYNLLGVNIPEAEISPVEDIVTSHPPPLLQLDKARKLTIQNKKKKKEELKKAETSSQSEEYSVAKGSGMAPVADNNVMADDDPLNVPDFYFIPRARPETSASKEASSAKQPSVRKNESLLPSMKAPTTTQSDSTLKSILMSSDQGSWHPSTSLHKLNSQAPNHLPSSKPPPDRKIPPPPALPLSAANLAGGRLGKLGNTSQTKREGAPYSEVNKRPRNSSS